MVIFLNDNIKSINTIVLKLLVIYNQAWQKHVDITIIYKY